MQPGEVVSGARGRAPLAPVGVGILGEGPLIGREAELGLILPALEVVADRAYGEPASGPTGADQTETRTYELTITGSRCSLLPVDSVPPVQPPNHFYGSGQDIVELSAQLCPGAAH